MRLFLNARSHGSARFQTSALVIVAAVLSSGCSDTPRELPSVGRQHSQIINGSVDNSGSYEDVVAMFTGMTKCTGTIVAKAVPYAFVLTAAHCVDDFAPQVVVQGVDHDAQGAITYQVQDYSIHPGYNGSVNDFAMIRVTGAGAATPVRAVLTPAEDNIGSGTQVTHLGYGVIDTGPNPDTGTSLRHITGGVVSSTTSLTLTFNATSSGVCFGDSGGPNIHNATGKVAGVNSSVSSGSCNGSSFSGRASAVLDSYITPFINNAPPPPVDCDGCFEASTTGSGACIGAVNACFNNSSCSDLVTCFNACSTQTCINSCAQTHSDGLPLYDGIFDCVCDSACSTECATASMCTSSTPPPTTNAVAQSSVAADAAATTGVGGSGVGADPGVGGAGVGGAPPAQGTGTGQSDGWRAGNAEDENIEGNLVLNACSMSAAPSAPSDNSYTWLLLGAAAIALATRRRSS